MDELEICKERHERIDERLFDHDKKIDRLTRNDATNTAQISNLCNQIGGQTKALWGLSTSIVGALIGFFFYAIQSNLFN